MAKEPKSTKAPSEVPATAETKTKTPKTPAQSAEERGGEDLFCAKFVDGKPVEPAKKLAPQAMVIINTVRAAGKEGISRKNLITNLKGVLVTRQPEGRIVTYYQKALKESGAIEIVSKPAAVPAPTPAATAS